MNGLLTVFRAGWWWLEELQLTMMMRKRTMMILMRRSPRDLLVKVHCPAFWRTKNHLMLRAKHLEERQGKD